MERFISSNVSLHKINCKEWMNMLDTSALLDTYISFAMQSLPMIHRYSYTKNLEQLTRNVLCKMTK